MSPITAFFYDEAFLSHQVGEGHPERPARLQAIVQRLRAEGLLAELSERKPSEAALEWLQTVHAPEYVASLEQCCAEGMQELDADTHISVDSYHVARRAAGAGIEAADLIVNGAARNAFCAVRPPGHHAEARSAMGFCLLNNIAITARYLQRRHGLQRIFIVDFDVHHGNGTQHAFDDDPSVFFFSIHQYPFYPGTGAASERGQGAGQGATINVPLEAGRGDADYAQAFETQLAPAVEDFRPDCLLVSAGFDAHADDPLALMQVSDDGYAHMSRMLAQLASEHCAGRLISFLEGGYNLDALARCVALHLRALKEVR